MTKTFAMNGSALTCVIQEKNFYGSIEYDFASGDLTGHKPDNMEQSAWLLCVRKFVAICLKMNAPFLDSNL